MFRKSRSLSYGMMVLVLIVAAAPCALGQSTDIPRGVKFVCNNLPAGVTATATLTWYNSAGTPLTGGESWTCSDGSPVDASTVQPGDAGWWTLTIVISEGTTCNDEDFSVTRPAHISSRCASTTGPGAAHFFLGN